MIKDPYQRFVAESWEIEGIALGAIDLSIITDRHKAFVDRGTPTVDSLWRLAQSFAGGRLRDQKGMNVTVGGSAVPSGGPYIPKRLDQILEGVRVEKDKRSIFRAHRSFEQVHPFTDGNGRVGRLLWLWHMNKIGDDSWKSRAKPFLHTWYYQSLEA